MLCGTKNISCAFTEENKYAPDYTVNTIFKNRLIHRACNSLILNIELKPTYSTLLTLKHKILICFYKLKEMSAADKVKLFIKLFPKKQPSTSNLHQHNCTSCQKPIDCHIAANNRHTLASNAMAIENKPYHLACIPISQLSMSETQSEDMDIDNNITENKESNTQDNNTQKQQPEQKHQQKIYSNILNTNPQQDKKKTTDSLSITKTEPTFDWLANFPISPEMEDKANCKLKWQENYLIF